MIVAQQPIASDFPKMPILSAVLPLMLIKFIPPPVMHHQGGWDEMLMFLIPALLLTWVRNKQKNENSED